MYGDSRMYANGEMSQTNVEFTKNKVEDSEKIEKYLEDVIGQFSDGMYFDEFINLAHNVGCDLFFCIYHCVYQYIPCAQNFLMLRANFKYYLEL